MTTPKLASTPSRGMRTYPWPPKESGLPPEFEVAGVTSIISGGVPKPFLEYWAAKETAIAAVKKQKAWQAILDEDGEDAAVKYLKEARYRGRDRKADRGTIVHAAIDAYLAGEPMTKAELEERLKEKLIPRSMWKAAAGMIAAGQAFLFEMEPEVLHNEATVFSREHGYAGTADLLVKMRVGKATRNVVVDFKTSPRIYDETSLQLCAYSRADFVGMPDGTELPMPKNIRHGIAVRLQASGKYEPVPFVLDDELFDVFVAARTVAMGKGVIEGARRAKF